MPPNSCVENCSNNSKSQPNLNFYIFPSGKQWRRRWLQAIGRAPQHLKFLRSYLFNCCICKGSVFLQFCDKIQLSMHQIFTQIYLTVSIGQSHMESPTELFTKKFFFCFQCDGQPIFPHLNPTKIPPKQAHAILPSSFILQNKSRRHMNPVANK